MSQHDETTNYERLPESAVPPELRSRVTCLQTAVALAKQAIPERPERVLPVDIPKTISHITDVSPEHSEPAGVVIPIGQDVLVVPADVDEARAAVREAHGEAGGYIDYLEAA